MRYGQEIVYRADNLEDKVAQLIRKASIDVDPVFAADQFDKMGQLNAGTFQAYLLKATELVYARYKDEASQLSIDFFKFQRLLLQRIVFVLQTSTKYRDIGNTYGPRLAK